MTTRIVSFALYLVLPIGGILFFNWDWRSIIVLYWLENITIGVQTVISMIRTTRVQVPGSKSQITMNGKEVQGASAKPFMIIFFMLHYGIFTIVHGVFVFLLASGVMNRMFRAPGQSVSLLPEATGGADINLSGILIAWGLASLVQVAMGFFQPRASLPPVSHLFFSPYARIIVLHVTVLFGAGVISYFSWPPAAAILLVALHFLTDLFSQSRAKKRESAERLPSTGVDTAQFSDKA